VEQISITIHMLECVLAYRCSAVDGWKEGAHSGRRATMFVASGAMSWTARGDCDWVGIKE
jgi:hypothetical protein